MSDDDKEDNESKRLYELYRHELLARQRSNSEKYDAAILTLSTTFLGLSLAIIKEIVNIDGAKHVSLLYCSWALFCGAIVLTVLSFLVSQLAIDKQLDYAYNYYIKKLDEYRYNKSGFECALNVVNWGSGMFFIMAVLLTALFVAVNT